MYSIRCQCDILKVLEKKLTRTHTLWVHQTFIWDKWAETILDFVRFSSCVPLATCVDSIMAFFIFEHQYYIILIE